MGYARFDRRLLRLRPLGERAHLIRISDFAQVDQPIDPIDDPRFLDIADRILRARAAGAAVILSMGAHLLRAGASRYIIDLMTTAVFDLFPLENGMEREPGRDDFRYYYRPLKTILVRTVRDGGTSFYIRGDHRRTLPTLYKRLKESNLGSPTT